MSDSNSSTIKAGYSVGSALAAVLSYLKWHSVSWAFVHFMCGWIYVIYWALEYGESFLEAHGY